MEKFNTEINTLGKIKNYTNSMKLRYGGNSYGMKHQNSKPKQILPFSLISNILCIPWPRPRPGHHRHSLCNKSLDASDPKQTNKTPPLHVRLQTSPFLSFSFFPYKLSTQFLIFYSAIT